MKTYIYILTVIGLLTSCSNKQSDNKQTQSADSSAVQEIELKPDKIDYPEIVLRENSIDSFSIPFPEKEMLKELRNFYKPYWVERNIGQQDGPDFEYIDILRLDTPIVYFMFDPENKFLLDQIIVHDSTVVDQYGVRVGDAYLELKHKRNVNFKNSTNYHQHTYLYTNNSNIYYEVTGDLNETQIENIEELELTEEQLENWTVQYIIWRKKN